MRLLLAVKHTFMSGHSKWSTIKRAKGVTDARRSLVFSKLARLITVAARVGGKDPAMNFRLRLAIDKARGVNMPNDNIERAIKSGSGELKDGQAKEVLYEGFGPGGVSILAQAVTDNSNRTASEVRMIFQKLGGRLGGHNSVAWMFKLSGVIRLPLDRLAGTSPEEMELGLIDAGADDVNLENNQIEIFCNPEKIKSIAAWLGGHGFTDIPAVTEYVPQTTVAIDEHTREQLYRLLDALEEQPDVTEIYSNDV